MDPSRCYGCGKVPTKYRELYDRLIESGDPDYDTPEKVFDEIERITGSRLHDCCRYLLFNKPVVNDDINHDMDLIMGMNRYLTKNQVLMLKPHPRF